MQRKRSGVRMARLVKQWRESGERQASFARRHRIPTWTFWYWCRKLSTDERHATAMAPAATPAFVPVQVADDSTGPVLEIVLSGGGHVQVRAGASADLVRAAVTALRATC